MFKLFKREKKTVYVIMLCDNVLCKGWDVAWFTSKEAAREYCDFKNRTRIDPDTVWDWYEQTI